MGARKTFKLKINPNWFRWVLAQCKTSIRSLGDIENGIGWNEKTIRRSLKSGLMSAELLNEIAKKVNVNPNYLRGVDAWTLDVLPDKESQTEFLKRYMMPRQHPYIEAEQDRLGIPEHIKTTLLMHGVNQQAYSNLTQNQRERLFHELDSATTKVLRKWFPDCREANAIVYRKLLSWETEQDVMDAMIDFFISRGDLPTPE